jgi:anti-sigma B factor antagonist
MSLKITERQNSGIAVLDLEGRLVAGETATLLRDTLTRLAEAHHNRVVLQMSGVNYIDSTGLGSLVMCHATLGRLGGGLRLCRLTTRSLELLLLTKLTTVFELYEDEQNAVNSFFPGRTIQKFDILSFVESHKAKRQG